MKGADGAEKNSRSITPWVGEIYCFYLFLRALNSEIFFSLLEIIFNIFINALFWMFKAYSVMNHLMHPVRI
jgi:hypothetical protein